MERVDSVKESGNGTVSEDDIRGRIQVILRDAAVFLHFSHDVDTPDWHTDHTDIIDRLDWLRNYLLTNTDTCPLCKQKRSGQLKGHG